MNSPDRNEVVRQEPQVEPAPAPAPVVREPVLARVRPAYNYRAVQAVWLIVGVLDALLVIRFLMKLLAASTASSFVTFMYGITDPLLAPFRGIFATSTSGGYVFEPESVVAIVIYALIGWGIAALIRLMTTPRGAHPVA